MKTTALILCLVLAGCVPAADSIGGKLPTREGVSLDGSVLDAEIKALMAREEVKGFAVAVFEQDRITHLGAYGFRIEYAPIFRYRDLAGSCRTI